MQPMARKQREKNIMRWGGNSFWGGRNETNHGDREEIVQGSGKETV